jgi:hypothetical protein
VKLRVKGRLKAKQRTTMLDEHQEVVEEGAADYAVAGAVFLVNAQSLSRIELSVNISHQLKEQILHLLPP